MPDDDIVPGTQRVSDGQDYRILRRLKLREGLTGIGSRENTAVGVVVDIETTGIGDDDVIIELALRRFRFDADGVIVKVDRQYSWLEDPGRRLPIDIARLTGLTDEIVHAQSLDDDAIEHLLSSAQFVCAHNARFDRAMIEKRLPGVAGLNWACSCNDVDWRELGFEGRALGWLLTQVGLYHGAHRAGDDVDAVIALLAHAPPGTSTVLAHMLERARAPTWRFHAVGAAFELKDQLRQRGYRWDGEGDPKSWWLEVADADRAAEEWWLAGQVYTATANPKALGPIIKCVTWRERYARAEKKR